MNAVRGPVLPAVLAVGIAAASVAGVIALSGSGSGADSRQGAAAAPAGPPPIRNAAWTVDGAHDAASLNTLSGFWIGTDVVVRGSLDGLHAMKRSDGTSVWDLPTPGGGTVCGMSAGLGGGVGIVASEPGTSGCTSISAVDAATGKVLWTTGFSTQSGASGAGAEDYAVAGGVAGGVAVIDSDQGGADAGVIGLDLRTGAVKWRHASGCEHLPGVFAVSGARVVMGERCRGQAAVHVLDAGTGDVVAGVSGAPLGGASHPQILSADPLAFVDGGSPQMLTFVPGAAVPVADTSGMFAGLTEHGPSRAQVAVGGGVVCAGGRQPSCWSASGGVLAVRGLPNAGAEHHDVYVVEGGGDAARVITTGVAGHPRASLCRVGADGSVVVEADLSQPVSDYLGKSGYSGDDYAFSDAKDLYLVDPHPAGQVEVMDVRLG